jgi:hypothetical protein
MNRMWCACLLIASASAIGADAPLPADERERCIAAIEDARQARVGADVSLLLVCSVRLADAVSDDVLSRAWALTTIAGAFT